jgi:hypothetical protein
MLAAAQQWTAYFAACPISDFDLAPGRMVCPEKAAMNFSCISSSSRLNHFA